MTEHLQVMLRPTIAINFNDAKVSQCASCGCLVSYSAIATTRLAPCPACGGTVWWAQDLDVGPFVVASTTVAVTNELIAERARQDDKWGEQNHPAGTSSAHFAADASNAKEMCQFAADRGFVTWVDILNEEVFEAFETDEWSDTRKELVQVGAVVIAFIESGDRAN